MIVIGADTHKYTHALAAVDAGTGRERGARQVKAEEQGYPYVRGRGGWNTLRTSTSWATASRTN
jgi:hypothetical protein